MTAPAPWPRSILPRDRNSAQYNPMQDGIARLYRLMEPGDKFAGMTVTVINGHRTSWLVLDRDGVRRVVVDEQDAGKAGAA